MDTEALSGKTALITGAAGGIGSALARELARRGADLALVDLDAKALDSLAADLGELADRVVTFRCDLTSDEEVAELEKMVAASLDGPDLLFNNAGVLPVLAAPEELQMEDWRRAVDINLLSVIRCTQAFLPQMLGRGGHIVNTASLAGLVPSDPEEVIYTATKWGVVGYTLGIAASLRPRGVGVSCLVPGPVRTRMLAATRLPEGVEVIEPAALATRVLEEVAAESIMIFSSDGHREYVASVHADYESAVQASIAEFGP